MRPCLKCHGTLQDRYGSPCTLCKPMSQPSAPTTSEQIEKAVPSDKESKKREWGDEADETRLSWNK